MQVLCKKTMGEYKKKTTKTGGEAKPQTPPPEIMEIVDMIPSDLYVDLNKDNCDYAYFNKTNDEQLNTDPGTSNKQNITVSNTNSLLTCNKISLLIHM
ncbi:hypothetical protein RN001_005945 [Aquatica leii]|uniref:Uncharacterized protein n=1 Tax=Aquatica leii TaxID=1421715 RepID=A0AAN7PHR6_9COLE|nr:hypothetical protein RN001_005945 [Aquatica leii]